MPSTTGQNDSVFFLQTAPDGALALWVGLGDGAQYLDAIHHLKNVTDAPSDLKVNGIPIPFRVASDSVTDGNRST